MYYVEHQSLPLLDVEEGFYIFKFELRFHKAYNLPTEMCCPLCYVASMWLEARFYLEIITSTSDELGAATYQAASPSPHLEPI